MFQHYEQHYTSQKSDKTINTKLNIGQIYAKEQRDPSVYIHNRVHRKLFLATTTPTYHTCHRQQVSADHIFFALLQ